VGPPDYSLILEGFVVPTDGILRSEFDHYRKLCIPLSPLFAHLVSLIWIVALREIEGDPIEFIDQLFNCLVPIECEE
jgi:hypothetical protein